MCVLLQLFSKPTRLDQRKNTWLLAMMRWWSAKFPRLSLILSVWQVGSTRRGQSFTLKNIRLIMVKNPGGECLDWRRPISLSLLSSHKIPLTNKYFVLLSVVYQEYASESHNVYVIVGNAALFKCEIPSYVADFVSVTSWVDSQSKEYFADSQSLGNFPNLSWDTQAVLTCHFLKLLLISFQLCLKII